jgi:predicted dehydrogenase
MANCFANMPVAHSAVSMCFARSIGIILSWGLEVIGENGSLRADYHNYSLYVQLSDGSRLAEPRTSAMNHREVEHFLDCVLYGAQPVITPKDFLSTILILEAACTSLETKMPVNILRDI